MAADRENRGSRQPQTCPMEADAAQMKAEWELGKSVGSDRANEKNTFVTVLGLERSRALVEELTGQAEQALSGFGDPGFLLCLARALAGRRS